MPESALKKTLLENFKMCLPAILKCTGNSIKDELKNINCTNDTIVCTISNEEWVKYFFDLFKPHMLKKYELRFQICPEEIDIAIKRLKSRKAADPHNIPG